MIDPTDVRWYRLVAQVSDDDEAGFDALAGPRPGKEPPDDPPQETTVSTRMSRSTRTISGGSSCGLWTGVVSAWFSIEFCRAPSRC